MYKKLLMTAALSAGLVMAGAASAKPVSPTPPPAPVARTITLDSTTFFSGYSDVADPTIASGDGNINEHTVLPVAQGEEAWQALYISGEDDKWFSICGIKGCGGDKLEDSIKVKETFANDKKVSGTFTIAENIWQTFSDIAIGLKFGGTEKATPDWAVFDIADGAKSGVWSVNAKYGLSHFIVFAKCEDTTPPNEVPLPGAAWMMLIGLTSFLGLSRRKSMITA